MQAATASLIDAFVNTHPVDRSRVPARRSPAAPGRTNLPKPDFEARSKDLLREARRTGSHVLFTTYPAGTTPVNPHLAWAQTYENDVIIDWLLAQHRR